MSAALQMPQMSEAEWNIRCELAAVYHVNEHLGWTDTINTHMTVRVPGEPNHFLINNYGDMFDEVTASSLVKMDMEGNVLTPGGRFNNAGFTIHSGVYKARPDANCVLHTHTRAGAAVSLLKNGLRPISQDVLGVYDEIAYHTYGVPASVEECEELAKSCAHGSCVVLENHGLLTFGDTVHGAMMRMWSLERACELEVLARQMGEEPVAISNYVIQKAAERGKKRRTTNEYGLNEWKGLVRQVERKGFDFRR